MNHLNERIIKNKLGLLNLAAELRNISRACKVMGTSRDTFYRYQNAVEEGGIDALIDKNRKKPNLKNRVDEVTETAVIAFAIDYPAFGQLRASNELRKTGIFVSPSGVRSIWLRDLKKQLILRSFCLLQKSFVRMILLRQHRQQFSFYLVILLLLHLCGKRRFPLIPLLPIIRQGE